MTAFDVDVAHLEVVALVGMDGGQVGKRRHVEAHDAAVGLGLAQQFGSVAVHGDGQAQAVAALAQSADMVDMGVGEQQQGGGEPLAVHKLVELRILVGGLHGGVDQGALLGHLVVDDVAINSEVVEGELLDHAISFR